MMRKKRMIAGVAAAFALAALVGCQNSKDFDVRGGVLVKYVGAGTKVKIPSSVTTIEQGAFYGLSITSVSIPSSVTKIYAGAFSNCTSLTSLTVPANILIIFVDGNFESVYNGNGKQAGTYVKNGNTWTKR